MSPQFIYRCIRNRRFLIEQRSQTCLFGKSLFGWKNIPLPVVKAFDGWLMMEILACMTDLFLFDELIRDLCFNKKKMAMKLSYVEIKYFLSILNELIESLSYLNVEIQNYLYSSNSFFGLYIDQSIFADFEVAEGVVQCQTRLREYAKLLITYNSTWLKIYNQLFEKRNDEIPSNFDVKYNKWL